MTKRPWRVEWQQTGSSLWTVLATYTTESRAETVAEQERHGPIGGTFRVTERHSLPANVRRRVDREPANVFASAWLLVSHSGIRGTTTVAIELSNADAADFARQLLELANPTLVDATPT